MSKSFEKDYSMKNMVLILLIILASVSINTAQDMDSYNSQTTISGYGELHYNYEKPENGQSSTMLDFHRFVLFLGYNFNDQWSLKSEIELEHNVVNDDRGDLQLEQAYINYHHSDLIGFQAGVLLVSAGLVNEFHEPQLFFGVERPEYHSLIIPTTWFGNGIGLYGNFHGFDYRFVLMEGLDADGFSESSALRGGRQKGFKSDASNLLSNLKIDYTGILGLKLGGSFTYNNAKGDSFSVPINLIEFHAQYSANNLYAVFEIGNINYDDYSIERSFGYYFDIGYNIASFIDWQTQIIPFFRYSDINTAAKTMLGGDSEKSNHLTQIMFGVSVKPLPNIVFKLDYGQKNLELDNRKTNLFNLGVGYSF